MGIGKLLLETARIAGEMDGLKRAPASGKRKQKKREYYPDRVIPSEDNRPDENSVCPDCGRPQPFTWHYNEKTWRCRNGYCRTAIKFVNHIGKKNVPEFRSWRVETAKERAYCCARLMATELLDREIHVTELRQKARARGFSKFDFRSASVLLGVQETRCEAGNQRRYWCLTDCGRRKAVEILAMDIVDCIAWNSAANQVCLQLE